MNTPVIEVSNVRKEYKGFTAVDGINFTVYSGDVFGFLGPNGAGKSTTIRMLTSLIHPTSGSIKLFGKDLSTHREEILANVGAIVERPDMYLYLNAINNLELVARMYGANSSKKHLMSILEMVGLAQRAESKVKTFSHGMKQRLGIACTLVHNPQLIILDEPTTGLDPQGMKDIRDIILHLSKDRGKTIFLSSHILPEIELTANRMVIINRGKIVVEGEVKKLLNDDTVKLMVHCSPIETATTIIAESNWNSFFVDVEDGALRFDIPTVNVAGLNQYLVEHGIEVHSLVPTRSLEDYFLKCIEQAEVTNMK
ncbi:MAG: ABC transporter ATP-binding protein [Candidatus Kapaibacterium sp.]|nr:ABC transporter ATP-binding protein [Bacteroidota bacterium]